MSDQHELIPGSALRSAVAAEPSTAPSSNGLLSVLSRWKYGIILAALLMTLLTWWVSSQINRVHVAETTILIENLDFGSGVGDTPAKQIINDQIALMTSRSLAETVLQKAEIRNSVALATSSSPFGFLTGLLGTAGDQLPAEEKIYQSYFKQLNVHQVPSLPMIKVVFRSDDLETSTKISRAIADQYLTLQTGLTRAVDPEALKIQEQLVDEQREKVVATQQRLEAFKVEASEASTSQSKQNEQAARLSKLTIEANAEKQLLDAYLARYKESRSQPEKSFTPVRARLIANKEEATSVTNNGVLSPLLAGVFLATLLTGSLIALFLGFLKSSGQSFSAIKSKQIQELQRNEPMVEQQPVNMTSVTPPLAPQMADLVAPAPALVPESLLTVSKSLTLLKQARLCVITPEGNGPGPASTALARLLASVGPTIVVDLAGEARASRVMVQHANVPGIMDILAGRTSFDQAIHADKVSGAHIITTGNLSAPATADSIQMLSVVLDALQRNYRYVIVDAGAAGARLLSRLVNPATGLIVECSDPQSPAVGGLLRELGEGSFATPVIVQMNDETLRSVGMLA